MKLFKKIGLTLGSLLLAGSLAACGGGTSPTPSGDQAEGGADSPAQNVVNIKLAHTGSEEHQYHIGATHFKEIIEEKSGGTIQIEIFPNAQLGSEKDATEGVINGTIDMAVVAADSSPANIVPELNVFGIPYIFKDREHVYSVLDGEIGKSILAKVDEKGMKGLGFWEIGFRNVTTNNKAIVNPEDMNGLKIRVQPSPVWQAHMKALGANPTPVDFNELYSALEQGVVDGQENPIATIMSMKFYEVQKNIALTEHTYSPAIVLMSNKVYDSLTDEQKAWLEEAVQEAADAQRQQLAEAEEASIAKLKEMGINFTEPNREAFAEATKDVANAIADKVPQELVEQIRAAAQ